MVSLSKRMIVLVLVLNVFYTLKSQTTTTFTTPAVTSWTVPSCVTSITVQVWAAGGGGGGTASYETNCSSCSYVEACSAGGGGGGGGYVSRVYAVTPGDVYAVTVGAGGIAGLNSNAGTATSAQRDGGDGGNSLFSGPATSVPGVLTAFGGTGGKGALINNNSNFNDHMGTNGAAGTGGTGSGYTTMYQGGTGAVGMHSASCWDLSGGGGGGAGTSANGGTAQALVCYGGQAGGTGGSSFGGAGASGRADAGTSTQTYNGNAGSTIGGGGGGGLIHMRDWFNSWKTTTGGAGARGEVRILYNASSPGVTSTSSTLLSCTTTTAQAVVTYTNGSSTINWSGPGILSGATSATAIVNAGGIYSYTASVGGCSTTGTVSVSSNTAQPAATATSGTLTCITVTAGLSGGPASGVNYSWAGPGLTGGTTAASATATAAGNYTLTTTSTANGCTNTAVTTVTTNTTPPQISIGGDLIINCITSTVTLTGSSTTPGVTYSWTAGGATPTNSTNVVSSPGTYTLTITNPANGCKSSSQQAVLSNQVLPDANGSTSTTLTCLTTTATLTGSSLTSGVSYSWAPGGSTPTSSTTGVTAAGTYSLIVTDPSNGCKKTATVTVSANTQTPQVTTSTNNLSCLTTTTTISATSTVSPVGYTWTGPGITSATTISTITINQGGTYNYTVSNTSTGCKTTGALSITSNTALPTATATGGSLTCVATTATLTGGPSTGVTYSWSGTGLTGPTNTTTATATSTGSYTLVTTSTTNGCTNTAVAMIGSNTTPPQINIGGDLTLTCNIPTVTLNGSSTTSGVTYSWTTGGSTPTSSTTVVSSPGIYTLTVTDPSNGCKSSLLQSVLSHTIQPNLSIGSTQTITCANTSVTLTGSSTTSGVTYSWSPGVSTPTSAITTATTNGTYSLTVTDPGNSCKTTSVVTVLTNTTTPTSTSTVSGVLNCTLTTVNASATTTTTPVSYTWTGTGITSTTNTNTIAANQLGNFNYTITNTTNGCTTTGSQTITQNIITPSVTASGTQTITCASPSVSLTGSATPANSIPVWTGGACSGVNTYTATACSPNTYTLTVTDPSNGCTNTALVDVVPSVGVPSVTATNSGSITCSTTTAEITASTAMTPVSYSWSGPGAVNGSTTPSGTVTVGGTYQCVVTNTNTGCTSTVTTIVPTNTTTVTANATTTSSITCTTTSINITATPGGSNYGYIWTGPGTITNNTTENPTVDAGGDYTVTIIDNTNGCTGTANVNVPTNTVVPTLTLSPSSLTTTCANPTATLSATSSSDPDATYTWTVPSTGTLNNTNSSNPVANGSGIFTVQVTNTVSGCVSATETVSMTADANTPVLNATATNTIICEGNTSTLNITGADTYTWSTTETTTTITVTPNQTTTYTVAGTNTLTGCSNFTNITVNVTPTPTIGISTTAMTICEGSNTTLTLTGATSYTITNPSQTTTNTITVSPTTQTTYTVIGESSNCTSPTQTITINVNTLPQLSVPNQTTCAGSPVTLTANGADTYTWSTTETTNTIAPTPGANTTYTVTGTNTLTGCTSTITTVDVTVNALPTVTATANPNTTCTTGTVNLTASTTATSYTWTTGNGITGSNQNTQSPSFPASTLNTGTYTYTLQVTDANGCISPQATATLNVIDVPNANFDLSNLNICQNANGTISINTPQSGVTYDWNINGQTITNTNPLTVPTNITNTVGTYTVSTIASIGTCSNTAANTLTVNALPNITLVNPTASACENTSTHLDIAGPNSTYNYAWTNGQSTATGPTLNADPLTQTNAGTYTVTATDQNGCSNRTTGVIDAQICQTYIPEIFTPNGDGKNDGFVIKNIENYPNNKLKIFNRWGNKVYEKDGYLNEFEGYANTGDQVGKSKLPAGTYYVILEYGDNKTETYNGYLLLQY